MKLFIKLLLFLLVLGIAGPFIIKKPDGRPLLTLNDIKSNTGEFLQSFRQMSALLTSLIKPAASSATSQTSNDSSKENTNLTRVHKWRDKEGQWQFSDQAPENTYSETITINPNQNIINLKTMPLTQEHVESSAISNGASDLSKTTDSPMLIPGIPTLNEAKKTIESAKMVQDLVNSRAQELEQY